MLRPTLFCSFALLSLAACSGSKDDTAAADSAGDNGGGAALDCATDTWASRGEDVALQSAWMGSCFLPETTATMQAIDADKFASFTCSNCHGSDMAGGTYAMPAATPLSWYDSAGWDPKYFDASTGTGGMATLSEQAAALLGEEPWSEKNPSGFGCANCHEGL